MEGIEAVKKGLCKTCCVKVVAKDGRNAGIVDLESCSEGYKMFSEPEVVEFAEGAAG